MSMNPLLLGSLSSTTPATCKGSVTFNNTSSNLIFAVNSVDRSLQVVTGDLWGQTLIPTCLITVVLLDFRNLRTSL